MEGSENSRKLEKSDVSPWGGHYHSLAEGGVLPAEAAFCWARRGA